MRITHKKEKINLPCFKERFVQLGNRGTGGGNFGSLVLKGTGLKEMLEFTSSYIRSLSLG